MQQTFKALPLSLAVSALLIYMLLAARYEDLLRPLAIMFSISLAPIGAGLGLWAIGSTFNLFSRLGMILLMALVAKNAILLVDFTDIPCANEAWTGLRPSWRRARPGFAQY